jgi:hypothetical protein
MPSSERDSEDCTGVPKSDFAPLRRAQDDSNPKISS